MNYQSHLSNKNSSNKSFSSFTFTQISSSVSSKFLPNRNRFLNIRLEDTDYDKRCFENILHERRYFDYFLLSGFGESSFFLVFLGLRHALTVFSSRCADDRQCLEHWYRYLCRNDKELTGSRRDDGVCHAVQRMRQLSC